MPKRSFLGRFHGSSATQLFCRTPLARSLRCEHLEDRRLLAQLTVTTDQDIVDLSDGETSLREAIFAANIVPGADEIVFDFNHDGPATILLTQGELAITDSLTITGPGTELLTIDASGSDPTPDENNGDGSRVFRVDDGVSSSALTVTIEGVTVTGGDTLTSGGGISNRENLTLRDVVVNDNSMFGTRQYGGGVFTAVGTLTIIDSQIIGNSTPNYAGGGIGVENATLIISGSRIAENQADLRAGGIDARSSQVAITDTVIEGNHADGLGGGLAISQGTFLMQRSTVRGNSSTREGGGLSVFTEQGAIIDSLIVGNSATVSAGGIRAHTNAGTITILQSTISQNDAPTGSALLTFVLTATGRVEINHSTISDNDASDADGAAVFAIQGRLAIADSIVAANAQESQPEFELAVPAFPTSLAPSLDVHYSLIGDNAGTNLGAAPVGSPDANGNIIGGGDLGVIDPLLGPLADNGGPTLTHALLPGSPAINAGEPASADGVNGVPTFDQRGEPFKRVFAGRIDIGAYERQSFVVDTLVDESDSNYGPGDFSLREAINLANLRAGADTIEFSPALTGGTIMLRMGSLNVKDAVQIVGLGAEQLTIDNSLTQGPIFVVDNQSSNTLIQVGLSGLTLTGSKNSAIRSLEDLTIDSVIIRGNSGLRSGGITVELNGDQVVNAKLTVRDSRFEDNRATATTVSNTGGGISFSGRNGELAIENSTFVENSSGAGGGGIGVGGFSNLVNITDTVVEGNHAARGGGIFIADDNAKLATLERVLVRNNTAVEAGGGLHLSYKAVTIIDGDITGNRTTADAARGPIGGGGIYKTGGTAFTIQSSIIADNSSASSGGGILLQSSSLEMSDSTVDGNSATREGGGLLGTGSLNINIARSTISNNAAVVNGGGVAVNGKGSFTLRDSTVNNNTSQGAAGGVHVFVVDLLVSNSTISANSAAGSGGGLSTRNSSSAVIEHSTITSNKADSDGNGEGSGGGIYAPSLKPITLDHTIVAGNFDLSGAAPEIFGNSAAEFSLIGVGAEFLGPLADNGGPTKTHALLPGSPAINAGEPTSVGGDLPEFDQRGEPFTRVFGAAIDIGAFEAQSLIVDTLADELDDDYSAGDFSLREAVDLANRIVGANTIEFSPTLTGGMILLERGELIVTGMVEVIGLGAELLTIDAQQRSRIFNITATAGDFAISGMTLTNGSTPTAGSSTTNRGGAVRSTSLGTLALVDMRFVRNRTLGFEALGGAVYAAASLTIDGCEFLENSTAGSNANGGAVNAAGLLTINESSLEGNQTTGANASGGAAASAMSMTVTDSTFAGNKTLGNGSTGGAIDTFSLLMTRSTVSGNSTSGLSASGGGISIGRFRGGGGTGTVISDSVITNNFTIGPSAPGGGVSTGTTLTIERSTISGNYTLGNTSGGGGINAYAATLTDCLIENNRTYGTSSPGGAVTGGSGRMNWQINGTSFADNKTFGGGSQGGAVSIKGQLSVTGSTFEQNAVYGTQTNGGAISGDNLSITSSSLTNNSANAGGGGAVFAQGAVTIADSILSSNRAISNIGGSGGGGGAIHHSGSFSNSFSILRSKVTNNEAIGQSVAGGGIRSQGNATIGDSEISGNRVIGQGAQGGGLFSQGATIVDSTISDNQIVGTGGRGGGASLIGSVTVLNSTISGNQITGDQARGGAIYASGLLNLRHSTVTANRINTVTGMAGGVWVNQSQSVISHSIIAGNFTANLVSDLRGQPQIQYSLIGSSAGTELVEAPVSSPDANGNLIGGAINGVIDPLLASLAENGGPTKTHALLPGSPAINAGNAASPGRGEEFPEFDQRGAPFARVAGGRIDIGAFELQPSVGTLNGDVDGDGDVDGRDFLAWQRGVGRTQATRDDGDVTGNGAVDGNDLAVWQETYGEEQEIAELGLRMAESESADSQVFRGSQSLMMHHDFTRTGSARLLSEASIPQSELRNLPSETAVDRAFDHWAPTRRFSMDFGDIAMHRRVKRRV
jgi:CSLREA domain-containing protein